jgi:hypothetical protein
MVVPPGLPEDVTLFIELTSQVVAQITQPRLELLLEGIQDIVDVAHGLNCLLFVFLDFSKS